MRRLVLSCLLLATATVPAVADFPCDELWAERNAMYKDAGYCFKTQRAIRAFGNAGCRYDDIADVPLSAKQRSDIADIQRQERSNNCPK